MSRSYDIHARTVIHGKVIIKCCSFFGLISLHSPARNPQPATLSTGPILFASTEQVNHFLSNSACLPNARWHCQSRTNFPFFEWRQKNVYFRFHIQFESAEHVRLLLITQSAEWSPIPVERKCAPQSLGARVLYPMTAYIFFINE